MPRLVCQTGMHSCKGTYSLESAWYAVLLWCLCVRDLLQLSVLTGPPPMPPGLVQVVLPDGTVMPLPGNRM